MRVLVNCSNATTGGGLQVAHSFVSELPNFKKHEWFLVLSTALVEQLNIKELEHDGITIFQYEIAPNILFSYFGIEKELERIEARVKPDVVFTVFGPSYWRPEAHHLVGYARPHYIYPESPFFDAQPLKEKVRRKIKKLFHLRDFKNSNEAIVTESESVTERVKQLFPSKNVQTVSNTYNQLFDSPERWASDITLPSISGCTLLTISANYPHKNLQVIPRVIDYLKTNYPSFEYRFVITIDQESLEGVKEYHLDHMFFLGKVDVCQCPNLYKQADFMFLPTLLECFSASYVEAMKMKVPIITSGLDFAFGVCGESAEYFDPTSPVDIGEKIVGLANDSYRQKMLVENGCERLKQFETSETRAIKYLTIIEKLAEKPT